MGRWRRDDLALVFRVHGAAAQDPCSTGSTFFRRGSFPSHLDPPADRLPAAQDAKGKSLVRRAVILVVGSVIVAAGVFMLVLPGPGILTILLGIGVLAQEFAWARRLRDRFLEGAERGLASARERIHRFDKRRHRDAA